MTSCAYNYANIGGDEAKSALGLFSGIFFGIFQLTQISGNLIESLVYKSKKDSPVPLFIVYLSCAMLGAISILFLRRVDPVEDETATKPLLTKPAESEETAPVVRNSSSLNLTDSPSNRSSTSIAKSGGDQSVVELLLETIRLWRNPKMLLLIPLLFLSGLEQGWVFGAFTTTFVSPSLGKTNIGYVMVAFGAADVVGSFVFGKLSDVIGRPPVLVFGFVCQTAVALSLLFADVAPGEWAPLLVCAAVWGFGDASWNTQISAILGELFPHSLNAAFANFKLFQSLLMGVAFLLGSILSSRPKLYLWLLVVFLVVSIVCVLAALAMDKAEKRKAKKISPTTDVRV